MAEAPSGWVASPSDSATPTAHSRHVPADERSSGQIHSNPSPVMVSASFQAVNARVVPPNLARAGDSTPHNTVPTQPGTTSAVAPSDSQTPQAFQNPRNQPSHVDGLDSTMADTANYGTRSRNRAGNARPNYAEDQEMELDFHSAATTKKKPTNEVSTSTPNAPESKRAEEMARWADRPKESTPAASTGTGTSKKRKAVGGLPQQSQTPPVSTTPAPTAVRKPTSSAVASYARETNMLTFTKHKACLNKKGELVADDGTKLSVNDHVYLVCEPPGDPYYLCRIMEFLHVDSDNPNSPVDSLRVNWYYRPRDVQRFNSDTRLLYATMHSDMCPITSLRGKCTIQHKSEIPDMEAYRKEKDSFYFVQVFDRFIRRWYECIPVKQIINVPEKVKKALDERWKFIVVETNRVKELTSAVKTCKRCTRFCASNDSVDCAICKNSYHMNCVQPPLPKKPSRGFAWACGPCSRASERKKEAGNTPISGDVTEADEEPTEEEAPISNDSTRAPSPSGEEMAIDTHPATQAEIALAKMWPMRYLGIHCRVEDALQYDDRAIYPRASSRLGPRHQGNVNVWHGRPVELVKPAEIKKRYNKNNSSHKKDGKLTKETVAALEAEREEKAKRPKWVQDEPPGYVPRGEDYPNDDPRCTAKLIWKMPEQGVKAQEEKMVDDYIKKTRPLARTIGVPPFGVNFLDKAMELLRTCNYTPDAALKKLAQIDRKKDLHEPVLTKADLAKFEEGVAKYGSEHRLIRLHMKTQLPHSDIVRFYYLWKKTPKGKDIWGNYGGRKGAKKRIENDAGARAHAEVAHDADDSAFDNDKANRRNRAFVCKFCNSAHSRQWRRAPGVSPGQTALSDARTGNKEKKERLQLALCLRCAGLWRKYAIQWEDVEEVSKKVTQGGGKALKRRIDEELLRELLAANEAAAMLPEPPIAVPSIEQPSEPPKKKSKLDNIATLPPEPPKKKEKPPPPPKEPTPPPPPIIPAQPTWRVLPCAICKLPEDTIACSHCRLTVHRQCFGVKENDGVRPDGSINWICEQCQNDRHPEVSTDYACCLCLTEETLIDLVEPPKVSHKKKTDREREKERLEKELADGMRADYRNKQLTHHRPVLPREPLKRTTGNNWVHVYCAVWSPEIRFSDAKKLEVAEGFQRIPPQRYEAVCKLCKNKDHSGKVREQAGACVSCFTCQAPFHASCAFEAGYTFGFDVSPVKNSRKDQVVTAKLGQETGSVQAGIWCKEHVHKGIIHPVNEIADDSGRTALQAFTETYKQADLALTGTVRKADLAAQVTKEKGQPAPTAQNGNRRESAINSIAAAVRRGARTSTAADNKSDTGDGTTALSNLQEAQTERRCIKCKIDVTPRWHRVVKEPVLPKEPTPPPSRSPPHRRMSITLGEIADLERQRSQESRTNGAGSAPSNGFGPEDRRQSHNAGLVPPALNGVNRESMHDGPTPQLAANGGTQPDATNTAGRSSEPPRGPTAGGSNCDPRMPEDGKTDEGYHKHALPQYQNPASANTPPRVDAQPTQLESDPLEFLCHKCFIKKKIDPTPSPSPPRAPEPTLSPPRQFPLQLDWIRPPPPPPSQPARDAPFRMPWDEPPQQSQPAPPSHVNGMGSQPPPFGNRSSSQGSGYPPYGSQPNGFHVPPPPSSAPNGRPSGPLPGSLPGPAQGPPPMHERQPSFGYGPPPHHISTGPPQYGQYPQNRPPPLPGYPPAAQPLPNGTHSPRNVPPPMQSPSYMSGVPQQQQHQYQPRRTESPYPPQLAPIGQPLHSNSQTMFNRPDAISHANSMHASHQQQQQQQHMRAQSVGQGFGPPASQHQTQQTQQQHQPDPNIDPALSQPQAESQPPRPTTPPREGQTNGSLGPGGASASPSLRNLLH